MSKRAAAKVSRKPPQQSRSRATVTAILDAMTRILDREGPEAASTSRVAEVAGVSVGTLYQYFANRDAILDALQDRELERAMDMIKRVLVAPGGMPDRHVARQVIEELLTLYRAAPALHRVLAVEGLRVTAPERVQAFDLRMVTMIRSFLVLAGPGIRRTNLDAAAFVVYQSVRASMLAYLLERPPGLDDAALVDEATELILGYLVGPEPAPRHAAADQHAADQHAADQR
jgi:AcrR family transcriptional regulator